MEELSLQQLELSEQFDALSWLPHPVAPKLALK